MDFIIVLAALCFLMFVAYRGYSVILFAPVAALGAVLLTDPTLVAPMFTGLFMDKMVGFVKLYFPVFLLGAIFGKVIELSGFSKSIVSAIISIVGRERAILSIVAVCAILTYGGVSLFVVVFAVYPFAAEMFRQSDIPKRLIPGTIALGAFTFTMDSLPGTPQIQNIIPTTFFKTDIYAAPWLGTIGAVFILIAGLTYLEWRRRQAAAAGEGYGTNLVNEPEPFEREKLANPWIAILPLVLVGVMNKVFTIAIPAAYGKTPFLHSVGRRQGSAGGSGDLQDHGHLGGGRRAAGRHPHRAGLRRQDGILQVRRRLEIGHQRSAAGFDEHRVGIRLRRRDRSLARFSFRLQRAHFHPQPAGQ